MSLRAARPAISEFALFMGSSTAFQGSRLIVNLVAAATLTPATFGMWGLILTVLTYSTHGNLGVLSGANRRIPILLGGGRTTEALRVEQSAFGGTLLAGLVMTALIISATLLAGGDWVELAIPLALMVAFQQVYLFYQVSLRARLEFNHASVQQLALAALFPILGLPLLAVVGIIGLSLAQAAAFGCGAAIVWALWRRATRPQIDGSQLRLLVREGAPIMLSGLAFAAMTSIDRWVIVAVVGQEPLGQYTLASMVSSSMLFITMVVSQQFYPRMAHQYGAGARGRALLAAATRQSALSTALVLPVVLAVMIGAPLLIPASFPRYVPAIGAMQILAVAYLVLSLGTGYANLVVTAGWARTGFILQVAVAGVASIASAGALAVGIGLSGVALAMLASFAVYTIGMLLLATRAGDE